VDQDWAPLAPVPPPSPSAAEHFGTSLPLACRYAELLAREGVAWGLLGPRELPRLWDRHLINSAALAPLVPPESVVLDVGSGAGLPGLPVRIVRPDLQLTLLEPMARRVRFLELCLRSLGLPGVTVLNARAEESAGKVSATVVTARAVAPLSRLVPAVWPLVRPGGQLLAVKGRTAEEELSRCSALPTDLDRPPEVVRRCTSSGVPLVTVVRFCRKAR